MRTRTSAHLPRFGGGEVRGPPGPHGSGSGAGMRTRTSAHRPGFGGGEVRGPPGPQLGFAPRPECGRGRPRTAHGSAAARCADLPVRIGLRIQGGMRTRTSAHLPRFGVWGCADLPVRIGLRIKGGMRTRTSAHRLGLGGGVVRGPPGPQLGFAPRPECGRGRPRTAHGSAAARCADLPVRNWASHRGRDADEVVRAPPRVRRLGVRGPPGPHLHWRATSA